MEKRNTTDLKMESRIKTVNQQDQNLLRDHQIWRIRKKSKSCHSRGSGSL